jgi:signal transduction histidine kinase
MESLKNNVVNCPAILTGMSHEMRTYMNAIVAFSFLMKENSYTTAEKEEFSNHIFSACEQLMQLFDSFLDSAKIDTGNSIKESRVCRLDTMLDELMSEFRSVLKKEGNPGLDLYLDVRVSNSAKATIDQKMIFRIIRSLFQNSIKNTRLGYIKIGLSPNYNKITFYVLDTGHAYDKYKEFLNTEDMNESLALHNDTYTAINITLAKKLIELLGGTIWIERNDTDGSAIYFSIPARIITGSYTGINNNVYSSILI